MDQGVARGLARSPVTPPDADQPHAAYSCESAVFVPARLRVLQKRCRKEAGPLRHHGLSMDEQPARRASGALGSHQGPGWVWSRSQSASSLAFNSVLQLQRRHHAGAGPRPTARRRFLGGAMDPGVRAPAHPGLVNRWRG